MNLRGESVLLVDNGLYVSLAQRLMREFGKVGYFRNYKRGFPSYHEIDVGRGLDGITVEPHFWKAVDNYSLIAYPDVYEGDQQEYLRKLGKRVFGSGMGDELELHRIFQKKLLKAVGLPVGPYVVLKGFDALREFLKEHDDQIVKISKLRGITETWKHKTYRESEMRLDALQHELGMRKYYQVFIVEEKIETDIEYGYDCLTVDGQFPNLAAMGLEIKDVAYGAVVQDYNNLPDGMQLVNEKLAVALRNYKYRNFFSTEIRDNGEPYLIDCTCRVPSPAGEAQMELWGNLGEMMFLGAEGKMVDPKPLAKYAVQSIIYSDFADENWQAVYVPPKYRDNVKLYYHSREKGFDYVIPQSTKMNEIGSVVTIGDHLDDVIKENKKIAEMVSGDKLEVRTDRIDDVVNEFEEMEKKGMDLTPAKKLG